MIGKYEVMQYGETPMLVINKSWLSPKKIKDTLSEPVVCKEFLAKFDVAETPAAPAVSLEAAKEKEELLKKMAALTAQVAALSAQNNGHANRIDPIQKAA